MGTWLEMADIRHNPFLKFNYNSCKFALWITSKQRVLKMKLPARHLLMASCCILWEKSKGEVLWWPKRTSLYSDTFFGFAAGQESTWCISLVVVLCTMFTSPQLRSSSRNQADFYNSASLGISIYIITWCLIPLPFLIQLLVLTWANTENWTEKKSYSI